MRDILITIIQTLLALVIPILAAKITHFLVQKTKSEEAARCILQVTDAVKTAVLFASQTYCDSLKKDGTFGASAQREAFEMAAAKAKSLLPDEATHYLEKTYGDVTSFLEPHIEAAVKAQK